MRASPLNFASERATDHRHEPERLNIKGRSRVVPGPRALVGGVLVAIAVIGTYAVSTGLVNDHSRQAIVANRDLPAGVSLQPTDLKVVRVELGPETGNNVASTVSQVNNTVLLGPVRRGEFIQGGNVVAKSGTESQPEVSFALPRSRAIGGDLRSGELVDVVVTQKGDDTEPARTAVSGARVVKVDRGSNASIGSGGELVITVAVIDRSQATSIATAIDQGDVTLIRTTGVS